MSLPFHTTRMGHTFYEGTMPALVQQLVRLNENLERLVETQKKSDGVPVTNSTYSLAQEAAAAHAAAKSVRGQAYYLAQQYDTELARKIWNIAIPGEDEHTR